MSPEERVSWWVGMLIDIRMTYSCCSILLVRLWLLTRAVLNQLANSRLIDSYNLDEAVALNCNRAILEAIYYIVLKQLDYGTMEIYGI